MNILTAPEFWNILEESGSINESRGLRRIDLRVEDASLTTFSKTHSYGEYIFDWSWANAYEEHGLPYYPKLTAMVPFTPATAPHFLGPEAHWQKLLLAHDQHLRHHSSAHFLFTTPRENAFLNQNGYHVRHSFQYHFINPGYSTFEDFLSTLKAKKAKHILQERSHPELRIERLTGPALLKQHAVEMFEFYLATLEEKKAIPYLTKDFFLLLFERLPQNVLYVRASRDESALAGALYYYDDHRLYGRYWGSREYVPHLHFELCYYQGIDFCLEKKLDVFEAGAQGEHKIARGFKPTLITSAHKIVHPGFARAIGNFIEAEKIQVTETMLELEELLPFKTGHG